MHSIDTIDTIEKQTKTMSNFVEFVSYNESKSYCFSKDLVAQWNNSKINQLIENKQVIHSNENSDYLAALFHKLRYGHYNSADELMTNYLEQTYFSELKEHKDEIDHKEPKKDIFEQDIDWVFTQLDRLKIVSKHPEELKQAMLTHHRYYGQPLKGTCLNHVSHEHLFKMMQQNNWTSNYMIIGVNKGDDDSLFVINVCHKEGNVKQYFVDYDEYFSAEYARKIVRSYGHESINGQMILFERIGSDVQVPKKKEEEEVVETPKKKEVVVSTDSEEFMPSPKASPVKEIVKESPKPIKKIYAAKKSPPRIPSPKIIKKVVKTKRPKKSGRNVISPIKSPRIPSPMSSPPELVSPKKSVPRVPPRSMPIPPEFRLSTEDNTKLKMMEDAFDDFESVPENEIPVEEKSKDKEIPVEKPKEKEVENNEENEIQSDFDYMMNEIRGVFVPRNKENFKNDLMNVFKQWKIVRSGETNKYRNDSSVTHLCIGKHNVEYNGMYAMLTCGETNMVYTEYKGAVSKNKFRKNRTISFELTERNESIKTLQKNESFIKYVHNKMAELSFEPMRMEVFDDGLNALLRNHKAVGFSEKCRTERTRMFTGMRNKIIVTKTNGYIRLMFVESAAEKIAYYIDYETNDRKVSIDTNASHCLIFG